MKKMNKYIEYYTNNSKGYWFKRKLFGWGWVPVKWQGWLVILFGLCFFAAGIYIGETDDAPGATLIGILIMMGIFLFFGYKKGEKPKWQWGLKDKK